MLNQNILAKPLVSVIIPNFNYGAFIQDCIDSVLNQSYPNIEIIVVDDGSTDDSVNRVEKYGSSIKLIRIENSGVSAARNYGMRIAKGDFLCFLDSDDTWEPDKILLQLTKFIDYEIGVVYSSINICDEKLTHKGVVKAMHKGHIANLYYKLPTTAIILLGCSSAMIRSELVHRIGEFDTTLNTSADWDFFRRLSRITAVDFVEKPLVNYRRHGASMSSGSIEKYYRDNELALIKQLRETLSTVCEQTRNSTVVMSWVKFQLQAVKALTRHNCFRAAFLHLRNLFFFYPWLRR